MADFGEIARKRREQSDVEAREERQKLESDREAREGVVSRRIDLIERLVRPMLNQAKEQCAVENIDLRIFDQFDVAGYAVPRRPSVKILCASPARKDDGYQSESPPVFIEVDDEKVYVGHSPNSFDTVAKAPIGTAYFGAHEELLERGIDHLLKNYFDHLKMVPWIERS